MFSQKNIEEGEEQDTESEDEQETRVLKDREEKVNMPRKYNPPQALKDFESANLLLLTSPRNLINVRPNMSPELKAAMKDLVELQREKEIIIKMSDKAGGFVILNYNDYVKAAENKLEETFINNEGQTCLKYPKCDR